MIAFGGQRRVELVGELFNVFNHANYGSYNTALSATSAATTALFGTPNQNNGTAYVPRQAQLGFKVSFQAKLGPRYLRAAPSLARRRRARHAWVCDGLRAFARWRRRALVLPSGS